MYIYTHNIHIPTVYIRYQGRRKLFYGGGLSKNDQGQKIKKKHWLKRPKAIPPKNETWTKI